MRVVDAINTVLLPVKLIIPQPVVAKLPYLTTNEDIRVREARRWMSGRVLDIGCGHNRIVREYRQDGGDGIGVDVFDWGEQDLLVEDTSALPFDDESFDTVSMIACVNHIPNRGEVLRETRRLLRAEGRLILTNLTPVLSTIWHKYAFWDDDQHERGMVEGEVYGLKPRELEALLDAAGFRVERKYGFSWKLNTMFVCRKR